MREYQVQGLNWMCGLHYNGINGILADEMVSYILSAQGWRIWTNLTRLRRVSVKLFKLSLSSDISSSTEVFTVLISSLCRRVLSTTGGERSRSGFLGSTLLV